MIKLVCLLFAIIVTNSVYSGSRVKQELMSDVTGVTTLIDGRSSTIQVEILNNRDNDVVCNNITAQAKFVYYLNYGEIRCESIWRSYLESTKVISYKSKWTIRTPYPITVLNEDIISANPACHVEHTCYAMDFAKKWCFFEDAKIDSSIRCRDY